VKNLTSCAGCTKKHARCHWRDVSRDEVGALDHLMDSAYPDMAASGHSPHQVTQMDGYLAAHEEALSADESDDEDSNPLEDLEALGQKEEREKELAGQGVREDEEGLQTAQELSRQGWEDSLRSAQVNNTINGNTTQYGTDTDAVAATRMTHTRHWNSAHSDVHGKILADRLVSSSTSLERSSDLPDHKPPVQTFSVDFEEHAETPSREEAIKMGFAPLLGEIYHNGSPPAHGGFRAVNTPVANGSTSSTQQTGWRAT